MTNPIAQQKPTSPINVAEQTVSASDANNKIVATTRAAMERASEMVLGNGYIVKTEVEVVRHPQRYADEAGVEMWSRVMAMLVERGCPRARNPADKPGAQAKPSNALSTWILLSVGLCVPAREGR